MSSRVVVGSSLRIFYIYRPRTFNPLYHSTPRYRTLHLCMHRIHDCPQNAQHRFRSSLDSPSPHCSDTLLIDGAGGDMVCQSSVYLRSKTRVSAKEQRLRGPGGRSGRLTCCDIELVKPAKDESKGVRAQILVISSTTDLLTLK